MKRANVTLQTKCAVYSYCAYSADCNQWHNRMFQPGWETYSSWKGPIGHHLGCNN